MARVWQSLVFVCLLVILPSLVDAKSTKKMPEKDKKETAVVKDEEIGKEEQKYYNNRPFRCPDITDCYVELDGTMDVISALKEEKETLEMLNRALLRKTSKLLRNFEDQKDTIDELEEANEKLRKKLESCGRELGKCKDEIKSMNKKMKKLDEEIDELKKRKEKLDHEIHDLEEICKKAVDGLTLLSGPKGTYYFETDSSKKKTWFEARDFCLTKGMTLVTIEGTEEDAWLKTKMTSLYNGETPSATKFVYMGLYYNDDDSNMVWSGTGTVATYTGGASIAGNSELYSYQDPDGTWVWSAENFNDKSYFICEVPRPCEFFLRVIV